MKKITVIDIIIISFILLLLISSILYKIMSGYKNKNSNAVSLMIMTSEGEYSFSINQKKTINIKGANGITVVEIDNGKFRFSDSECPNKDCVRMGWVSIADYPIICLPNQVTAYIISNKEKNNFDGISQ